MKIFHTGDTHFCPRHMEEVNHCLGYAVNSKAAQDCDLAVFTGDLFDGPVDLHDPCVYALIHRIEQLDKPSILLYGTRSHDPRGSLDVFKPMKNVIVVDRICQIVWDGVKWIQSAGSKFVDDLPNKTEAAFSCLPSIDKGQIVAAVGADEAGEAAADIVADLMAGWAENNHVWRSAGIPTVILSHGSVSGSTTEHGHALAGLDTEFTVGGLASSGAAACMLSHIHLHQHFVHNGTIIAYSSSIGRLGFGQSDPKGFLTWSFNNGDAEFEFHATPAKELIHFEYQGPPDMEELKAAVAAGKHVRVRYSLDEEYRNSVDREAIEAVFADAAELKIEARINPIVRTRAEGITKAETVQEKLVKWCGVTDVEPEPLVERLEVLV